jgi:uncharacterized protein (DUF885 family)
VQVLLDDQIPAGRRAAAVARLRRYAGLEPGVHGLVERAKAELVAGLANPALKPPRRAEVERNLATGAATRDGIRELCARWRPAGYEEPLRALLGQLEAYDTFLRDEVMPKTRADFAMAPRVYALALEEFGIEIAPDELTRLAHAGYEATQAEMAAVAKEVAAARGWQVTDYRAVIRELKKEQIPEGEILDHYRRRLDEIEGIIRRERLLTLPARATRIRLGTPAENAVQPAPHVKMPRLIGNQGEEAEFVLPLSDPARHGAADGKLDDSLFAAASWTLTAHEARPGHELQFSAMIERGVSVPRMVYAFNSTNVEGWGLYAEHITYPFMPLEGKLVSLQLRLLRAARAFLDPELQSGRQTIASARHILEDEVVMSPAFAQQEIDRYTFRGTGQAPSYFYGYSKLLELRRDVERAQGASFDQTRFHDFVLAQGLLPPKLLRAAVMRELGTKG